MPLIVGRCVFEYGHVLSHCHFFSSLISHWYSCFHWWSWSLSQNEMKRSGDCQVLQQKKNNIFKKKSLNGNLTSWKTCDLRQLFYRCRQLKRQGLLHLAWFFSNCVYVKVGENSDAIQKLNTLWDGEGFKYGEHWFLSWSHCLNFLSYYLFWDGDLFYCWFVSHCV